MKMASAIGGPAPVSLRMCTRASDNYRPYASTFANILVARIKATDGKPRYSASLGNPPRRQPAPLGRNEGVRRIKTAERKAVVGSRLAISGQPHDFSHRVAIPECSTGIEAISAQGTPL
jgi:hypothetical protein